MMTTPERITEVDDREKEFKIVYVPADSSLPLEEHTVLQKAGDAFGCLTSYCKQKFASVQLEDTQRATFKTQVEAHSKGQEVPDDMIAMLSQMTTCDLILLHPNKPQTNYIAVNMYVDDKGVAKELPVNLRASAIAAECGLQIQVMGDAFIAKQYDDDNGFKRFDFTLKDLDTSLPWFKAACELNRQIEKQTVKQSHSLMLAQRDEKEDRACKIATDFKKSGNVLFTKGKLEEAITEYSKGLHSLEAAAEDEEAKQRLIVKGSAQLILSNRSASYHKLGKHELALADAISASEIKPKWPKAYGRQADALFALERFSEAEAAIRRALELAPTSQDFKNRLEAIQIAQQGASAQQ